MSRMSGLDALLENLDRAYNRRSWHGTNLRDSVRGLTSSQLVWRPAQDRHNIWEIVVHAAYWKYVVWRRITGAKPGSFPLAGSNFFPRPAKGVRWKDDLACWNGLTAPSVTRSRNCRPAHCGAGRQEARTPTCT